MGTVVSVDLHLCVISGTAPSAATSGGAYCDFEAESAAVAVTGTGAPSYLESFRSAGVKGEALVVQQPFSFAIVR